MFDRRVVSAAGGVQEPEKKPADDGPCYVNPKQYHRILQRRAVRAKLEMEGRISKERKVG